MVVVKWKLVVQFYTYPGKRVRCLALVLGPWRSFVVQGENLEVRILREEET